MSRRVARPGLRLVIGCACALLPVIAQGQAAAAVGLSDLTGPWLLFVDDHAVASKAGVTRTYHAFQKYANNPVMVPDKPWEGSNIYIYGTVLPNESGPGYRVWYHSLNFSLPSADRVNANYATSLDGITWTKPELGIISFNGSKANNMFIDPGNCPSVMHTPWDASIQRPYKLMRGGPWSRFSGAYSLDALHWTEDSNALCPAASDHCTFAWDAHRQKYMGFPKVFATVNGISRRSTGVWATSNFDDWPSGTNLILAPDSWDDRWVPPGTGQNTQFYGMCGFAYESMYVGFLWVFRVTGQISGADDGPIFIEIVTSHDGTHWRRQEGDRPPILPLGPNGAWDDGMVFTAIQPLVEGDTLRLYYGGFDGTHAEESAWHAAIGMATLRKDGFASLDAGGTSGVVKTNRILGASGALHVNCDASAGNLDVEVLDENDNVLPGYSQAECHTLNSDGVDQIVTWATHAELPTEPAILRLRFVLQNASLYSFMAGNSASVVGVPTITRDPRSQNICPGGTATFTVTASGDTPLAYQWQNIDVNLTNGGHYSGTTSRTLTISNADRSDVGYYRCVVTNPAGSTNSIPAPLVLDVIYAFVGMGTTGNTITGVSTDGMVAAGNSSSGGFIWSRANGVVGLGAGTSTAGVATKNGAVVVGGISGGNASRWDGNTAGTGSWTTLPLAAGITAWTPLCTSAENGSPGNVWIAGNLGSTTGGRQAVCYTESNNLTSVLSPLPPNSHNDSYIYGASDSGIYAGQYQFGAVSNKGSRQAMGGAPLTALSALIGAPSTANEGVAKAISRDGTKAGGWSWSVISHNQGTIWTIANPTASVAVPFTGGDNSSTIQALNSDGAVAAGYATGGSSGQHAILWEAVHGTRDLKTWLRTEYGLNLSGWTLTEVKGMSSDGTVIAGNGTHNGSIEAWVALLGVPGRPPVITQQPAAQQNVLPGSAVQFVVLASGDGTFSYQWQKNRTALTDGGHYFNTATNTLTISNVGNDDAASYRCVVTVGCGTITSNEVALTVFGTHPADLDHDGFVDQEDLSILDGCFTGAIVGPPAGGCEQADLDHDGDVDLSDFGIFQRCMSGRDSPDPNCAS